MHYTNFNQTCQRNKKSISHSWYLSQLSPAEPPATICRSAFLRGWEGVTVSTGCCTLTTVVDGDVDASAVAMTLDLSLMLEERPEFLKRFSQRQCQSTTRNLQVKWFIYTVTNEGGNTWNNGTQPPQRWFNFNPEAHRISEMVWPPRVQCKCTCIESDHCCPVLDICRGVYSRGVYNSLARPPDPTATISMDFTYTSLVMAPLADNTSTRQRWKFRFTLKFHNGTMQKAQHVWADSG